MPRCLLLTLILLLFPLTGVLHTVQAAGRTDASPDGADGVVHQEYIIDSAPGWRQCADRCEQQDELGVLTRKGCREGCTMAREAMPHESATYATLADCLNAVETLDLKAHIEGLQKQCRNRWNHLYKRRGCTDAIEAYYGAWSGALCVVPDGAAGTTPAQADPADTNATDAPAR